MKQSIELIDSKPHYEILDGLRGVAALVVVVFHILEMHAWGDHTKQIINHGYLAVDFFFFLSGFVIAYAYDDRWGKMSLKDFIKRRIIRLQPMIIMGSLIGAALFYFQFSPSVGGDGAPDVSVWKLLLVMIIGATLIPVGKALDIRGWTEMHPLNGPAWSLFFEYIANIAYVLILRKVSKLVLIILVLIAAGITIQYAFTNPNGDLIGGWCIYDLTQVRIGFTRLAFPFLAGLLLARVSKLHYTKHAFLVASILLVGALCVPHLGGVDNLWNRVYECVCLMIMFPFIIWLGAGGKVEGKKASKGCKFLGDISYPLYITHYPILHIYMSWVVNNKLSLADSWHFGVLAFFTSVAVAYACMKFYDLPVREWLRKKFL